MKLFFKMKPLLRSAQAEEELAALRAELRGLRGALAAAEAKRQELEETHVSVTQEKNDLALQLQAVSGGGEGGLPLMTCAPWHPRKPQAALRKYHNPPPPTRARVDLVCSGCSGSGSFFPVPDVP